MDYRVRGFTRDVEGKKLFMDHQITSIQDYHRPDRTLDRVRRITTSTCIRPTCSTPSMLLKEIDLQNYLFNTDIYELPPKTRLQISNRPAPRDDRDLQRQKHLLTYRRLSALPYVQRRQSYGPVRAPIKEALEHFKDDAYRPV